MFCPKCGTMLMPKKVAGKMQMVCPQHGASDSDGKLKEKTETKVKNIKASSELKEIHSVEKAECPKCGNEKAYAWSVQTRAIDEAPTRFYKCTKCNHIWKEYS